MALKKKLKKQHGFEFDYHRIASVTIEPNQGTTILVRSYMDENDRKYEMDYAAGNIEGEPVLPLVAVEYLSFDYDETMNIKNAYEWLKQRPEFEGAEDV